MKSPMIGFDMIDYWVKRMDRKKLVISGAYDEQ